MEKASKNSGVEGYRKDRGLPLGKLPLAFRVYETWAMCLSSLHLFPALPYPPTDSLFIHSDSSVWFWLSHGPTMDCYSHCIHPKGSNLRIFGISRVVVLSLCSMCKMWVPKCVMDPKPGRYSLKWFTSTHSAGRSLGCHSLVAVFTPWGLKEGGVETWAQTIGYEALFLYQLLFPYLLRIFYFFFLAQA